MKQFPAISENSFILGLLQTLSCNHDISNVDMLADSIRTSLNEVHKNPCRLHGIRAEKMFGYLAAMMGRCGFIKHEDSGFSYAIKEALIPDYRIILNDGNEFFVEVKNCHGKFGTVVLTETYVSKMLNYPNLTMDSLKVAIYWSSWRAWTLVPINKFDKKDNKYIIKMTDALVKNEMGILGDIYFMAVAPLRLEFIMDLSKSTEIDESGRGRFTIQDVQIYSGRGLVRKDTMEFMVIFNLILGGLGGTWDENDSVILNNNKIEKVIFEYTSSDGTKQAIIGNLSRVITGKYNAITTQDGKIKNLQVRYKEGAFDFYLKVKDELCKRSISPIF